MQIIRLAVPNHCYSPNPTVTIPILYCALSLTFSTVPVFYRRETLAPNPRINITHQSCSMQYAQCVSAGDTHPGGVKERLRIVHNVFCSYHKLKR